MTKPAIRWYTSRVRSSLVLFFALLTGAGCVENSDDTASASDDGPSEDQGPCGGEACDPVGEYCLVPKDADEAAGSCANLPPSPPCPADDPCACLLSLELCENATCGISDHGWALLSCDLE
ncbi:MAG: hypothetical protein KC420_13415 [Myxococcales bacterium]|nr:hypothetical protein [Myxococcales bacterium]